MLELALHKDFKICIAIVLHRYRVGHKKVACLLICTCPCYCINFCIYAMLRTRATFSRSTLRVGHEKVARVCNTEINTVARTRAKRKDGYFFMAHAVIYKRYIIWCGQVTLTILLFLPLHNSLTTINSHPHTDHKQL